MFKHPARIFTLMMVVYLVFTAIFTLHPRSSIFLTVLMALDIGGLFLLWPEKNLRCLLLVLFSALLPFVIFGAAAVAGIETKLYIVSEEPKIIGAKQSLIVKQNKKYGQVATVVTNQFPAYKIGEVLEISGEPKEVNREEATNWQIYKHIQTSYFYPKISLSKVPIYSQPLDLYYKLKSKATNLKIVLEQKLFELLPEPQSSLVAGIIFGSKAQIPAHIISVLTITGLVHIIALSGYNITIISNYTEKFFGIFGSRLAFLTTVGFITLFIFGTGLTSSVIRAGIMGTILLAATRLGRQSDSVNCILLAAVIMALVNPYVILFDVGFQLSFAAVLGIIYISPKISSRLKGLSKPIATALAATLSAQIFTWPIISYYFGRVSVLSLIANVLVLPMTPLLMAAGFLTVILGLFSNVLGSTLGLAIWFMANYIIKISTVLAAMRIAQIGWKVSSPWFLLGYYLIMLEAIYYLSRRETCKEK